MSHMKREKGKLVNGGKECLNARIKEKEKKRKRENEKKKINGGKL